MKSLFPSQPTDKNTVFDRKDLQDSFALVASPYRTTSLGYTAVLVRAWFGKLQH
jgi:hypothetical protein